MNNCPFAFVPNSPVLRLQGRSVWFNFRSCQNVVLAGRPDAPPWGTSRGDRKSVEGDQEGPVVVPMTSRCVSGWAANHIFQLGIASPTHKNRTTDENRNIESSTWHFSWSLADSQEWNRWWEQKHCDRAHDTFRDRSPAHKDKIRTIKNEERRNKIANNLSTFGGLKNTTSIKTRRKKILVTYRQDKDGNNKYDRHDIADVFEYFWGDLYTSTTKKHEAIHDTRTQPTPSTNWKKEKRPTREESTSKWSSTLSEDAESTFYDCAIPAGQK